MLELRNICKTYKSKKGTSCAALKGINIKFPDTGMVFILGKSGSGKSTLLNIIGGLDAPDKGEIIILGSSTKNFKPQDYDSYRNTYLGFIFQEFNVLDNFSIYDNVALALRLQNKKAEKKKVTEILKQVGLSGFENRKPNEISGGQRQRVAVARALVKDPKIIFGDEPTGNLDSNTSKQVFNLLQELSKTRLVVIVSHDRDSAEKYADRIIELSDGVIIDDVTRDEKKHEDFEISKKSVFLPTNRALTKQELKKINDAQQKATTPLVFKATKKSKFKKTEEKESSQKSGFKLIKSKLPNKYATQIGISNFKSKPVRLIFTIFLTMVSLALFGLSQNFATYDLPIASSQSFKQNSINEIILKQGEFVEEYGSLNYSVENPLDESALKELKEKFKDLTYDIGYSMPMQFGSNGDANNILQIIMSMLGQKISSPYISYSNGSILLGDNYEQRLNQILNTNAEMLMGYLPYEEDDYSVAITDYFADSLILNGIIRDKNADGVTNYLDVINTTLSDTFDFKIKISGIIKTNYFDKYKDVIETYSTNPSDFATHEDYTNFSNDILNNYSIFYTRNENLNNYVLSSYNVAKATRYRFKDHQKKEYFEKNSTEAYETGYVFKSNGIKNYLQTALGFDEQKSNEFLNKAISGGSQTLDKLTGNKMVISLKEFNRMFGTTFEDIASFSAYYYDALGEINADEKKTIDIGFFGMMQFKQSKRDIFDVEVVGVYDLNEQILNEYNEIRAISSNVAGFVSDSLALDINSDNFFKSSIYLKLYDSVEKNTSLLNFANSKNMYHVSELSYTLYMVDEVFNIFSIIFRWVALILGVFSVILLFNFVTLSVVNKQKDIGILRAIGAKGKDVSKIFLIEALIVGAITTVLSWGLIFVGTNLVNQLLFSGFKSFLQSTAIEKISLLSVGFGPIFAVLIACFVVTLVATIIPTIKISRMKPVEAIKKSN